MNERDSMRIFESLNDVPEGVRVRDWAATWEKRHGVWGFRYPADSILGGRWRVLRRSIDFADAVLSPFIEVPA
jgi:hypothetical protein